MDMLERLKQVVITGDWQASPDLTHQALDAGHQARAILNALVSGMDVVSEQWRVGDMYIPDVLLAAKAMHAGMDVLRPHLSTEDTRLRGAVVIGTVKGDLHDIGKSLVAMMLEGAGFEVHDLGVDVSPAKFVVAARTHQSDIVAMSALLTTTLPFMRDTIRSLEEAGLRESVKVLVGGAPVTQQFADSIGADGFAPDGATAVLKARELIDAVKGTVHNW
jgi:5-methyltetrahydrofolate--homocysteine methyltransferase